MSKQTSTPIVLSAKEWNTDEIKYMQPKLNSVGGKAISMISTKTNRYLHVSTPMMMTWGISDWTDEKTGESNGKYSISLNFPSKDYETEATSEFLGKLKQFENQILDDAVRNSEVWWGESLSRDVVKHSFFPFLKYSKDKVTKKIDLTKSPSFSPKVPVYADKWAVEIYDTNRKLIFPAAENPLLTPMDFVPKKSRVACVLQCGGIWIGGKGWGVTWKLTQCVVKPPEVISVFGTCHIPDDICSSIEKQAVTDTSAQDDDDVEDALDSAPPDTNVEDSDEEDATVPVVEEAPKKKVVKKVAVEPVPEPVASPVVEEAPKKKIVKKKA